MLIRPSDGKFERTPFFDAIIRRGLRNSTRFDASTLTEDEIEALGMHRDETLGFKLQIRHFRSNRKELPPQGRGGGGVRKQQQQQQQQQSQQPPQAHRGLPGAAMVGARSLSSSHLGAASARAPVGSSVEQQQQQPQWGTEAAAVAAAAAAAAARSSGDPRWADEARWHRTSGGHGGGDRWTAWDANRWMPGSEGASPKVGDRDHRYSNNNNGHLSATPLGRGLTHASSPSAASPVVSAARHGAWDGVPQAGGVWGGGPQDRRPAGSSSWHLSAAGVDGRGDAAFERSVRNDVEREGFGGGGGVRAPPSQPEGDVRAGGGGGFHFHPSVAVEQQQGQQHPGEGLVGFWQKACDTTLFSASWVRSSFFGGSRRHDMCLVHTIHPPDLCYFSTPGSMQPDDHITTHCFSCPTTTLPRITCRRCLQSRPHQQSISGTSLRNR